MSSFQEELNRRLSAIREDGLYRELRQVDSPQTPHIKIGSKTLLNFSSNDYLGLANHPSLKEAAIKAVEKFGAGSGASRLICGSLSPHDELEQTLSSFKKTAAAISFSSGYAAAVGTICALLDKDDVIVIDKLVHASIVDAARLCGAKLRVFAHNDLDDLEKILKWADQRHASDSHSQNQRPRTLIVTESIFSMDGHSAPLQQIVALKEKYGAWLMIDEAHATGLYGEQRRGLVEADGVSEQIDVQMGTLGKALGASGGYICGSRSLIDYLVNRARSFIFSTAPVPAASAAASAGVRLVQSAEGKKRRDALWTRVAQLQSKINNQTSNIPRAIIPLIIGDETKAVEAASTLRAQGIFIPAIRFPTVAPGRARLRLTLSAAHSREDIEHLITALNDLKFEISA